MFGQLGSFGLGRLGAGQRAPEPPAARNLFLVGTGARNWSDSANWSLTSGGVGGQPAPDVSSSVTMDGNSGAGTITVDSNISVTSLTTGAFAGTIDATGRTITTGSWSGTGTATRTVNLTNATVNVTGIGSCWTWTTVTGLTLTVTGSTVNINGTGARTLNFGATTYATVNVTGSGAITSGNQNATFANLTRTGTAVTTDSFIVGNFTITGTLTLTGNSVSNRLMVQSSAVGTGRTVTAAAVVLTNVDFANITGAGVAAPFTGTSLGDAQGNASITFPVAKNVYWVGNGGSLSDAANHYALTSGGAPGAANYPLPQDTLIADASSFSSAGQTVTVDVPRLGAQNWSAVTNAPTLNFTASYTMYGSIDWPSGDGTMDLTGNVTGTFSPQTGTIDVNLRIAAITGASLVVDKGFEGAITITAPGATIRMLSHFMTNASLTLNSGTLTANNFDMQYVFFTSTGSSTRVINMGSGTWISTSNGTLWNVTATGMTLNRGTSTIRFISLSAPAKTFAGAGLTYYNLLCGGHSNQPDSSEIILTGANTFNDLTVSTSTLSRTITFPAGVTQTIEGTMAIAGASGAVNTVRSSTAASAATISDASGTDTFDFCSIRDITASGGATFNATNSTNVSGNTGINFV